MSMKIYEFNDIIFKNIISFVDTKDITVMKETIVGFVCRHLPPPVHQIRSYNIYEEKLPGESILHEYIDKIDILKYTQS